MRPRISINKDEKDHRQQMLLNMFSLGAKPQEVTQCLKQCKKQLTLAGAKADSLPGKDDKNVLFLSRLSVKAEAIVCSWFLKNCNFDDLPDPVTAITALEDSKDSMTPSNYSEKDMWRSILSGFVQKNRLPTIDDFLSNKKPRPADHSTSGQPDQSKIAEVAPLIITSEDAQAALTILSNKHDSHGRFLPSLLLGTIAAVSGNKDDLGECKQLLTAHPSPIAHEFVPYLDVLANSAQPEQPQIHKTQPNNNLELPLHLPDAEVGDPGDFPVLVSRKTQLPNNQLFMHVIGIVKDGRLVELSDKEVLDMFPETGDITVLPSKGLPVNFAENELSIWRVAHESPNKRTQYVAKAFVSRIYDVIKVPHRTDEPDKVRHWIQNQYAPYSNVYPVFQLADGPIIRLHAETTTPATASFDEPIAAYHSVPTVLWHGRMLVLKPFPAPDFYLDFAPTGIVLKRLLKFKAEVAGLPTITKAQLRDLADQVNRQGNEKINPFSLQRAINEVTEITNSSEKLDEIISELLKTPQVAAGIAAEKERAIAEAKAQAQADEAEIARLRSTKRSLENDIDQLRESHKKQADALSSQIRHAFERARAEGMKTLADMALFKSILAPQGLGPGTNEHVQEKPRRDLASPHSSVPSSFGHGEHGRRGRQLSSVKDINSAFSRQAMKEGLSVMMLRSATAAAVTTGMVSLVGSRQRVISSSLGKILASGETCTVSISGDMFSLSDLLNAPAVVNRTNAMGTTLGRFLMEEQSAGRLAVVELRGANRAPPESFLPELLAVSGNKPLAGMLAWADKDVGIRNIHFASPVVFILDFVAGKSVFPIMPPIAWEIAVIDTDLDWGDVDEPDDSVPSELSFPGKEFWESLNARKDSPSAGPFTGLPRAGQARAMSMASSMAAFGASEYAAITSALLAHSFGRQDISKLLPVIEGIPALPSTLAKSIGTMDTTHLGKIFNMEEAERS